MPEFIIATSNQEYAGARQLFEEYLQWLNLDLNFQNVVEELSQLSNMYAFPKGGIILCTSAKEFVGCAGIRKLDENTAEMKRLFVKEAWQRKGIATQLLKEAEKLAAKCGYDAIRLDTLQTMEPAMNLYLNNGYIITPAYYNNPIKTAVYFYKKIYQTAKINAV